MQMDKSSGKQMEQCPQNASPRKRKERKIKTNERKLTRTIKDLEKTVEGLKSLMVENNEIIRSISRASSSSYESGSASTLRSMSRASSTSYESVHGFGSTSTLRSEVTGLLFEEHKHALETQKLRKKDTKRTESDDVNKSASENIKGERNCLLSIFEALHKETQYISEGKTCKDLSSLVVQMTSSIDQESTSYEILRKAGEISNIQMEWKREAEYAVQLLEELNKFSKDSIIQETEITLSKPPEHVTLAGSSSSKDDLTSKYQIEKTSSSRHVEQLQKTFATATNVLKKHILSELAGAKLTHDNASIADLSDPNRPTKLAEMYSELYSNQWTDAFEYLSKTNPEEFDETLICFLYAILKDGYCFCKTIRDNQKLKLAEIMFLPAECTEENEVTQTDEVSEILAKHLSEAAKLSSNMASSNIFKAFVAKKEMRKMYRKILEPCRTYIEECVKLCWYMQVQTPPVCIDLKTAKGHSFVKDMYREYTAKGQRIAYVVWPALFLHYKGPMLVKGVAQGE